jgi:hypothetical protein
MHNKTALIIAEIRRIPFAQRIQRIIRSADAAHNSPEHDPLTEDAADFTMTGFLRRPNSFSDSFNVLGLVKKCVGVYPLSA